MSWRTLCFMGLVALGCAKSSENSQSTQNTQSSGTAPAGTIPHVKLSEQARLIPKDAGPIVQRAPDVDATRAGKSMADSVAKQCSDDKCRHEKCGPLCSRWLTEELGGSDKPVLNRNKRYFDCLGACMFPNTDAGK